MKALKILLVGAALALPACGGGGAAPSVLPATTTVGGTNSTAGEATGNSALPSAPIVVASPTPSPQPSTVAVPITITFTPCTPGHLVVIAINGKGAPNQILLAPDCNIGPNDTIVATSDNPAVTASLQPQPFNKWAWWMTGHGANITFTDTTNGDTVTAFWP